MGEVGWAGVPESGPGRPGFGASDQKSEQRISGRRVSEKSELCENLKTHSGTSGQKVNADT